ncbi:MAG: RDD family protein [Pseudomonadota bacterium]
MKLFRRKPKPEGPPPDQLLPPEGVPIHLGIAGVGVRLGAQIVDLLLTLAAGIALLILLATLNLTTPSTWGAIASMLFFFTRIPYYVLSEIVWNGQTLGKKLMKIKVVSNDGASLTTHALVVRNLMKEAEVFLPGTLLITLDATEPVYTIIAMAWIIGTLTVPLCNKRRRRLGDLIAGTYVIHLPQPVLLADVARYAAPLQGKKEEFTFLSHHLDHYGAFELQTLEDLLRAQASGTPYQTNKNYRDTLAKVVENIRRRIDYADKVTPEARVRFLQAFYNAQRAYLEQRQLFGDRRSDKHFDAEADEKETQ